MNMTSMSASNKRVVVIGGGAAGMMAAGCAAEHGAAVTLLEPNDRLGKKLLITGKGRCNVTNDCPWEDVLKNTPTNPRFLYSALSRFSPADAKAFFEVSRLRAEDRTRQSRLPGVRPLVRRSGGAGALSAPDWRTGAAYAGNGNCRTGRRGVRRENGERPDPRGRSHSGNRRLLLPADRLDRRRIPDGGRRWATRSWSRSVRSCRSSSAGTTARPCRASP